MKLDTEFYMRSYHKQSSEHNKNISISPSLPDLNGIKVYTVAINKKEISYAVFKYDFTLDPYSLADHGKVSMALDFYYEININTLKIEKKIILGFYLLLSIVASSDKITFFK